MAHAISGLEHFLAAMEYPATRDDLVREASRDGLTLEDVAALRALPDGTYDARCRVRDALAAVPRALGAVRREEQLLVA